MATIPTALEPIDKTADLGRGLRLPAEIMEPWLERFDWTWHQLSRNEFPRPFSSMEQFQLAAICADKVYFAQAFLREPMDPDHKDPYNFFDYQAAALRITGPKLLKCGAETGKTRDIIPDTIHSAATVPNGSAIIAAPLQIHLDEIVEAINDQLTWSEALGAMLVRWKKNPYHMLLFTNGYKIDFRPAGHDGEAFRGVHSRTIAKMDEAAKLGEKKQWSEFWRALLPGCVPSLYSVPDGRRDTEFYRLSQKATAGKQTTDEEDRKLFHEEMKGAPWNIRKYFKSRASFSFTLIHWPKSIMPPPFWTPSREQEFVERYGGRDSGGYQHNVEGIDGDPEDTVFPWAQLKHCVREIPEYRVLEILVDSHANEVHITLSRCEKGHGEDGPQPRKVELMKQRLNAVAFFALDDKYESDFSRTIRQHFEAVAGRKEMGADFGFTNDPSELLAVSVVGKRHRVVARLSMKHVTYDQQCLALDAMDDIYGPKDHSIWGTDLGNAGSAVAHHLIGDPRYAHKNYESRLRGVMFESVTENVSSEGSPIINSDTGKPARITMKELATDIMTARIQRQEIELPPDPDITFAMSNHTSKEGKHRIFSKDNDHIIDALRAQTLSSILGAQVEELFACGN